MDFKCVKNLEPYAKLSAYIQSSYGKKNSARGWKLFFNFQPFDFSQPTKDNPHLPFLHLIYFTPFIPNVVLTCRMQSINKAVGR